jgi:endonuclease/exonuclease/phosphatase family metal-dependent hydrolase
MARWAQAVLQGDAPDLILAQETHADWLAVWRDAGYDVILGDVDGQPQFKVRSAVIARPELRLTPVVLGDVPTLAYHGSYVACASWPVAGRDVLLMSVHASPKEAEGLERWPREVAAPAVRPAGRKSDGTEEVYDADALLATLKHQAVAGDVLAAGDLNEALGWDEGHPGFWGRDFFRGVEEAGLVSVLHALSDGTETPSHRDKHGARYQLDHVLATPEVVPWMSNARQDEHWLAASDHADWSDHAPIWFDLEPTSHA